MARVGGGGGPRWVWPLVILLILIGIGLLAWAFLAPPAGPTTQTTEQSAATAASTPTQNEPTRIQDIVADPSAYYGKDVTVDGRVTRVVGDQGLYLVDRDGGPELLGVLDGKVSETDLRNDDFGRFTGAIREVNDDELGKLEDSVDKPTLDALSNEKFYMQITDFQETPGP